LGIVNESQFLRFGITLVILPFVLLRLGAIAGLVTACVAPALAFSNSLALSTTRELAYRLRSIVVRLFSVYGPHLRKQLLCDYVLGSTGASVRWFCAERATSTRLDRCA
jgi:hypothetical protein